MVGVKVMKWQIKRKLKTIFPLDLAFVNNTTSRTSEEEGQVGKWGRFQNFKTNKTCSFFLWLFHTVLLQKKVINFSTADITAQKKVENRQSENKKKAQESEEKYKASRKCTI